MALPSRKCAAVLKTPQRPRIRDAVRSAPYSVRYSYPLKTTRPAVTLPAASGVTIYVEI
jgi:hypothetical protein